MQRPLKEIVEKIAKKHNVSPSQVEEIERCMWDFVRNEMSKGERNNIESFENIYLRYLGTLHVQKGMIKHLKKHDK